ncbi:MAG: PilT/PilU family type 4a pilus ATPase [Archangium sp.]|nr:PilT/PilU family type 4a pilus ATPase [Archangium sp.]
MARIDSFLRLVAEQSASDLHFSAGRPPTIRHHGDLTALPYRSLTRQETERFLFEPLTEAQRATLVRTQELDYVYVLPDVARFRVNLFVQQHGYGAVFRIIPKRLPTLDELLVPQQVRRLADLQNGLVLVCGPTGSGKTTTLSALVAQINTSSARHIITVEDPIEFVHASAKSVVTQRQVGDHVPSFAAALRSALRESPDVLVVGEMRDPETISLALQAAETGVLVLGTLHTNSAAKAVDRIIDAMPESATEQARGVLAVLLRAVVCQQLCKKANADGLVAVHEVLLQNFAVSSMIREGKVHQLDSYLQTASHDGSGNQSLDACLLRVVQQGLVEPAEALKVAHAPDALRKLLDGVAPE